MIGKYILSGRPQAIAMTAFSALVSLLIPPLVYLISGPVVGLITLRKGPVAGLQIGLGALLALQLLTWLAGLPGQPGLMVALAVWLPVWAGATVLRLTGRQGLLLLALVVLAALSVVAVYLLVGDAAAFWRQWLDGMLDKALPPARVADYKAALGPVSPLFTALLAAAWVLNSFGAVLLARWWQARLFNPGAFQAEFHALRLPGPVLPVSALVFMLMLAPALPWQAMFRDITVLLLLMYLLQGLAVAHRGVKRRRLRSPVWLAGLYGLLILVPHTALFLAGLGMLDTWRCWRRGKIDEVTK